jgi:hypothetical protein
MARISYGAIREIRVEDSWKEKGGFLHCDMLLVQTIQLGMSIFQEPQAAQRLKILCKDFKVRVVIGKLLERKYKKQKKGAYCEGNN